MAKPDGFCNRAEAYEAHDDTPLSPAKNDAIGDVVLARYSRRDVMRGTLGVLAAASLFGPAALRSNTARAATSAFDFEEIKAGVDETHHVAHGYNAKVLLRWGDPIFADAPEFDPRQQSVAAQLKQFGYNNDYIAFFPLEAGSARALLCVNHEYTNEEVMFPGITRQDTACFPDMTAELVEIEMAAHGVSIVEIAQGADGDWSTVLDSTYNRRITPLVTVMTADGPAAGHKRLKTGVDPTGLRIVGTLNNCAGGHTPWGTYLTAEENFHGYFWSDRCAAGSKPKDLSAVETKSYNRYGVPGLWQAWGKFHDRFNVGKEPNEPNRFGWIVEIDPLDPKSVPVKHTALGRFRHEGAECIINKDGRAVVYCGDDGRFEYVYRFISAGRFDPADRAANMRLLSDGTLSVAKFHADGRLEWTSLVFGQGPLTPENGFATQADVLIDARLAADQLGATRMDRPEDVQPNPVTGRVYAMLTNNAERESGEEDAANPRAENAFGHIIEMIPPDGDHAADSFAWDILVRCGEPAVAAVGAVWNPATSGDGWFACPDNAAVDREGRLWISTDQGEPWPTRRADGLYALETEGALRRTPKLFFRAPVGAEVCGPCFTPDGETLFVAVQHPGTDGTDRYKGFERASTFEDPATRWPDFDPAMPPRPSVLVITKHGSGKIA